jgi:exopolysaccharide biosynthesis operon protein EpsL
VLVKQVASPVRRRARFSRRVLAMASLALFGIASDARAVVGDDFQVETSVTMKYDDNLFLLPNPAPAGGNSDSSTWLQTESAGFSFDHQYSGQVVHADATVINNRFDSFHYLDYNAVNYNGEWQWQLGSRLTGSITVDHEEYLDSYEDVRDYNTSNLVRHTGQAFKFDWDASGPWHIVGGILHAQNTNPSAFTQVGTFSQVDSQLGVSYVSALGNSVTLQLRDSDGRFDREPDYSSMLDNTYKQREAEVLTRMNVGGWTTLSTRVGYVDRRYPNFGERDYEGWVGRVEMAWQPSARTTLKLVASRDIVDYEQSDSSYYWLNELSLSPAWDITPKMRLEGRVGIGWGSFAGAVGPTPNGLRSDRVADASARFQYKPTAYSVIGVSASVSHRRSNFTGYGYQDKTVGVDATLTF